MKIKRKPHVSLNRVLFHSICVFHPPHLHTHTHQLLLRVRAPPHSQLQQRLAAILGALPADLSAAERLARLTPLIERAQPFHDTLLEGMRSTRV